MPALLPIVIQSSMLGINDGANEGPNASAAAEWVTAPTKGQEYLLRINFKKRKKMETYFQVKLTRSFLMVLTLYAGHA